MQCKRVTVKKEIKGFFLIALDTAKEKSQQRKSLFFQNII